MPKSVEELNRVWDEVEREMPKANERDRWREYQRRLKILAKQWALEDKRFAEEWQRAAEAAKASQKLARLKLEEEKKQEESKQRALADEERQRESMSEKSKPATRLKPQLKPCRACNGLGGRSCSGCGGRGYQSSQRTRTRRDNRVEYYQVNIPCSYCSGGRVRCTSCGGCGKVVELE